MLVKISILPFLPRMMVKNSIFTVFHADVGKKIDVVKTPAVKPCIIDIIVTSLQRWFKKS